MIFDSSHQSLPNKNLIANDALHVKTRLNLLAASIKNER